MELGSAVNVTCLLPPDRVHDLPVANTNCPRWCTEQPDDGHDLHWAQVTFLARGELIAVATRQYEDGHPEIEVCAGRRSMMPDEGGFDSDTARRLAAVLLHAADVLDGFQ